MGEPRKWWQTFYPKLYLVIITLLWYDWYKNISNLVLVGALRYGFNVDTAIIWLVTLVHAAVIKVHCDHL